MLNVGEGPLAAPGIEVGSSLLAVDERPVQSVRQFVEGLIGTAMSGGELAERTIVHSVWNDRLQGTGTARLNLLRAQRAELEALRGQLAR